LYCEGQSSTVLLADGVNELAGVRLQFLPIFRLQVIPVVESIAKMAVHEFMRGPVRVPMVQMGAWELNFLSSNVR